MLTTPLFSGRPRGRHAVTALVAAGLLAGCASTSTHSAGSSATSGGKTQTQGTPASSGTGSASSGTGSAFSGTASAPLLTVMPVRAGQGVQGTTP